MAFCFRSGALTLATFFLSCSLARADGDVDRGEKIYQSCQDCHSLDANEVGPMHRGVFGRAAGTVPDYAYTSALKNSKIVWTEETLDQWLAGPSKLVPGTKMFFRLAKHEDRADVIAYLRDRAK